MYSGHLECPCTDRIKKTTVPTFATLTSGVCAAIAADAATCFAATAEKLHASAAFVSAAMLGSQDEKSAAAARAAASAAPPPAPPCPALTNAVVATQCSGMHAYSAATSARMCRAQCCALNAHPAGR